MRGTIFNVTASAGNLKTFSAWSAPEDRKATSQRKVEQKVRQHWDSPQIDDREEEEVMYLARRG